MTTSMLVSCPVGMGDLVRGDLRDRDGVVSREISPGLVLLDRSVPPSALPATVDRAALPVDDAVVDHPVALADRLARIDWPALGFDNAGKVTFRVHLQGASGQGLREVLIAQLERDLGWRNDPSDWMVNLDVSARAREHGGARVELGPWSWAARFGSFERLPASTPGPVAGGLLRMAKLRDGQTLADVCGGVGTVPVLDGLLRAGRGVTIDNEPESAAVARRNIAAHHLTDRIESLEAEATRLPLPDGSVDRVVSDLPFGKRVGSNEHNRSLYPAILREIERVLTADGRCVLLTDDKRVLVESVARARGLKISAERLIRYNGVAPTAYVVRRSRRPKRR